VIQEFFQACFFIVMAEMGDKTQLLALAFATKYKLQKVLIGVLIGSFLNHGLAVILGSYLSSLIPIETVRLIAACSFIAFGLWSLKSEKEEEEEKTREKFGPVLTVAMAFFIGELGDKTQLTAIALSSDAHYPQFILMGTVLGMLITSGLGIFVGSKLGKKIPEFTMKLISSAIFIFFGLLGLYETVPSQYVNSVTVPLFIIALIGAIYLLLIPSFRQMKESQLGAVKGMSDKFSDKLANLKGAVESVCLGEAHCGKCQGSKCTVGYARETLNNGLASNERLVAREYLNGSRGSKRFDRDKLRNVLGMICRSCLNCGPAHDKACILNRLRELFEMEYYGQKIIFHGNMDAYLKDMQGIIRRY
jgi:putative Ca2+/H+ antiporter (TMEM165/GDT1 family)